MDKFNNAVFKVIVAKLAQSIGFDSVTTTSMDVLTTLFEKYLILLGTRLNRAAELRCSTDPDFSDVLFMMQTLKISLPDLTDFMQQMEPVETIKMSQYPVASKINLGFTYPNNLDQTKREDHIPMHYPPLILHSKPELKTDDSKISSNDHSRKSSFVIAGRHGHEDSSDDNDYFIPPNDAEESDDSTSSMVESRHLTKPEDIPIQGEGTAPSSEFKDFDEPEDSYYSAKETFPIKQETPCNRNFISPALKTSPVIELKSDKKNEHDWLLGGDEPDKFKPPSDMLSGTISTPKFSKESSVLNRPHKIKVHDVNKYSDDDILKAKMEAAEKLIHSPPPFLSTSSQIDFTASSPTILPNKPSISNARTPINKVKTATPSVKETPDIERVKQESKRSAIPYASPKSMDDAISAVISRVTEEAKRAEEEAELMKFSHLVQSSSSDESEPDVSKKVEEILQLKSRGLNEPKSLIYQSSDNESDVSYMKKTTTKESPKKEKRSPVHIYTSSSEDEVPIIADKPPEVLSVPLPMKKLPVKTKKIDKSKAYESKPLFFPEDQSTIVKVKKKKHKPKPTNIENKPSPLPSSSFTSATPISSHKSKSKTKPENSGPSPIFKEKTPKIKIKSKEYKKHKHTPSPHVEKLVLKKFKSGGAEVIKKDDINSPDSPVAPPAPRSNLPVPKLSAAIPVLNVSMEKEKKKSKKEKKKKMKEKHPDKEKKRHKPIDVSLPKTDVVPKLTLCMGSNTKNFVVKRENSSPEDPFPPPPPKSIKLSMKKSPSESPEPLVPPPIKRQVITQTLSSGPVVDEKGNKIWICPSCNEPDDGSPMIGCDTCDDWYHWPCVGITCEPPENEDWYCPRCTRKRKEAKLKTQKKKRKKTIEY